MDDDTATIPYSDEGNKQFVLVSLLKIVTDTEFRAGYLDKLQGNAPPRFYDGWGRDRGRLVATHLLATGQELPSVADAYGLADAYRAAEAADVVL